MAGGAPNSGAVEVGESGSDLRSDVIGLRQEPVCEAGGGALADAGEAGQLADTTAKGISSHVYASWRIADRKKELSPVHILGNGSGLIGGDDRAELCSEALDQ
jgi:hypothetical protein